MSYSLTHLEGEPIILASLSGQMSDQDLLEMFIEGGKRLGQLDNPCSLVCDFRQVTALNLDSLKALADAFAKKMRDIQLEQDVFYVFLGANEAIHRLVEYLAINGFGVAVFPDMDSALSYLSLKIGSAHLKKSLSSVDTFAELDDTDRVQVQEAVTLLMHGRAVSGTGVFGEGAILRLEAVGMNKTTLIFPAEETVVGRRDSSSFRPDVDLSLWGGYRSGVSRRHALLVRKPGHQLYLVDLGSSNGTFINGERLVPEQPYLLHDGDEIKFGHLVTRVYFEYRTVNR